MRKITVRLTVEQWDALHGVAVAELESLMPADTATGQFDALESAARTLEEARQKDAAKREP